MEDASSMIGTIIDGSKIVHVRQFPLHRSYAVTADDRQWTRLYRDRNKKLGGWVELHPESNKLGPSMTDTNSKSCELCSITSEPADSGEGELQLHLVIMFQTEGELKHWGLFVGRESGRGEMLQVKGDWLQMCFAPESTKNLFADVNYLISRIYTMALNLTPKQVLLIKEVAASTKAPSALNLKELKGNCQTWCVEVLRDLVRLGIADAGHVEEAEAIRRSTLAGEGVRGKIKAMVDGEWTWVDKPE